LTEHEQREYVRDLASRVCEIATSEENERTKKRWRDVNALRKPDRAPVYCRPIGAWNELLPEEELRCSNPWLRSLEREFRKVLIKHDIGDDDPVEANFFVDAVIDRDPPNLWGVDIGRHQPDLKGGAWSYDPPIKSEADFEKLKFPTFSFNASKTDEALSKTNDLLGDILPVKLRCNLPFEATLCRHAADLRGLSELMMDMAVAPEFVHRIMEYLRDVVLNSFSQIEQTGLLSPNNVGPLFCSDDMGNPNSDGKLTCANLWGSGNSQEFDQVSPAMWEEFLLAYQIPILERFGLTAYGCCENLTNKIDGVLKIPNLRIFVSSAWTDLDRVIEKVGDNYTIMWRQKASEVVFPDDTDGIRRHLEDGTKRLKGCYYQIVLRELQTLAGHPKRLHEWTRIAIEAAEKNAS
jgi:hypothetical protein